MNKIISMCFATIFLISCSSNNNKNKESESEPVTDVSVTSVAFGHIDKQLELTAVTAFLKKSAVTAPVSSFITSCNIQVGSIVRRGQRLYVLESKEREALGGDIMGKGMGINCIRANASGVVSEVMQQSGGYVTEGTTLCTIANTNSMAFEVDVPTEDMRYAHPGTLCSIILPDGRCFRATLSTPLATMDVNAQTQKVPAHANTSFLPEGLKAKALLSITTKQRDNQILPKSAVQSDDNMTSFWIMIVSANGRAQKIPVSIGNSNNTEVEITSPRLSMSDRIITTGSYQLQDGDKVKVVNSASR
jgi:multidrug efflux pump subunit AcrA (membrane-fusion protein)